MSGHSKWSTIKHKKARTDEKKGKEFTKVAKEITIAVKTGGGGDPDANSKLKLAIQKAKAINMPNENISRAIKKGTGELDSEALEEIIYEGYAPGGVAVMLEIATDNRNRTAPDIRHLFSKHQGNMGETGCVNWMFKRVGFLSINKENLNMDEDELMMLALESGADDFKDEDDSYEVITSPDNFMEIKDALEGAGISFEEADLIMMPVNTVDINDVETAAKIIKLIDLFEDHDDVQRVYTNMNIPDEILEQMS
jgi:YebC/PmpR family DNA-binding regulatory protein